MYELDILLYYNVHMISASSVVVVSLLGLGNVKSNNISTKSGFIIVWK